MHRFLPAVGFSKVKKKRDFEEVLRQVMEQADSKVYVDLEDGTMFCQMKKEFGEGFGISVCGEYDELGVFDMEYYFPYVQGEGVSTYEIPAVERHADKESYAGMCDDIRVGMSLIFYVSNVGQYKRDHVGAMFINGTSLVGLSTHGKVLLPLKKTPEQREAAQEAIIQRTQLISAAKQGDEKAIESLTIEDMDTFSMVGERIGKEDILSIVDTTFMPRGVECDQYAVLGEILDCRQLKNRLTKEELYLLTIECNDIVMDVCINKENLMGEPQIGRRLKADIWLQGNINYEI